MRSRPPLLTTGITLTLSALVLSGCGTQSTAPDNSVSLAYTMPDVFTTTMEAVTSKVNEAGDVSLEAESIGNTYNDLTQRIVADAAAGTQADLALVPINRIPNLAEQGILQPVGDLLEAENVTLDDLDPAAVSLSEVDGELYGVPFALSAPMLYINADLFRAAGLDPDAPPTTWAEVRSAAKELTSSGSKGIVYQWDQDQWIFQSQVSSGGGKMLAPNGETVAFDDENGERALTFWTDLVKDGSFPVLTSTPSPDDRTSFTRGELGMWVGSSAFASNVESQVNFEVRTAQFPSEDGSPTPVAAGGSAIVLLATDESAQRSAAPVLATFAEPETSTALVKSTGYLPINQAARESGDYLRDFLAGQPLRQPAIEQISRLEPWTSYAGNRSVEISERITKELEAALKGVKTPEQALDDASTAANGLIGVK